MNRHRSPKRETNPVTEPAWNKLVAIEKRGDEDPASIDYDYELFLRNTSGKKIRVRFIPHYSLAPGNEEIQTLEPGGEHWVGTVDGGPCFDRLLDVEVVGVELV